MWKAEWEFVMLPQEHLFDRVICTLCCHVFLEIWKLPVVLLGQLYAACFLLWVKLHVAASIPHSSTGIKRIRWARSWSARHCGEQVSSTLYSSARLRYRYLPPSTGKQDGEDDLEVGAVEELLFEWWEGQTARREKTTISSQSSLILCLPFSITYQ